MRHRPYHSGVPWKRELSALRRRFDTIVPEQKMHISRRKILQLLSSAPLARVLGGWASAAADPLCSKLASDPLRPHYHLLPAHNWMNDPNGPIFYRGHYHMFYQYNPEAAIWGNMNWAHATSPDMIHWQHQSIAISPTPGGPDQDGVFSGSAVLENGRPTVIYTGVAPPDFPAHATLRDGRHVWRETQCMAVAQDENLRSWKKIPQPVIAAPPEGLKVTGFRDPCVWREGDRWMLILGSGTRDRGGMILLYTSRDLRNWTYLHPLIEGSPSGKDPANAVDSGDMWECPDFFPLGDKHVLLISTMGKVRWKVGSYERQRFTADNEGVVDWGSYYAAKTMLDRDGNRILWGWIPETRSETDLIAAGWAGVMSLPRVLSLSSENELQMKVASAANQLRRPMNIKSDNPTDHKKSLESLRIRGLAAELELQLDPQTGDSSVALGSDNGEPFATVIVKTKSNAHELRVNGVTAPLVGKPARPLHLQLFLDGSVLEVFVNSTTSLTARVYRIPTEPLRVKVDDGSKVQSFSAWQMTPISSNRLTSPLCH
jgi:beta-fructofuranosidase